MLNSTAIAFLNEFRDASHAMPRFHFHLRAGGMIRHDVEGTECADDAAAHSHAVAVARELMRHSDRKTRHWSMIVADRQGEPLFDVFFAEVDASIGGLSPDLQALTAETCRRSGALTDTLCAARATWTQSRMLLARARGKPHLAYARSRPR